MRELVQAIVNWIVDRLPMVLIGIGIVIILILIMMFFSNDAEAHDFDEGNLSGIYYDAAQHGEGIFVTHDEVYGIVGWALFTHTPSDLVEECEFVPAVFGNDGILYQEAYEVCAVVETGNKAIWFIAADTWHGSASGVIYSCDAFDFPILFNGRFCEERTVGMYIMDQTATGLRLIVTPFGGDAPSTLYRWYDFNTRLLQARIPNDA